MKKSKMPIIGAIIGGIGVLGLFGLFQSDDKGALLFGSLALIVVGAVLAFIGIKKNKTITPEAQPNHTKQLTVPQQLTVPPCPIQSKPVQTNGSKAVNLIPLEIDGYYKIYEYLEKVCFDENAENPYEYVQEKANAKQRIITFEFEEDNPHDENAIAIMLEDKKIGYVYRGMIYDMIHDFAHKGFQVCANISTFSPVEITYYIGFFKPKDACRRYVVPIKNKKLQEDYAEGDILSVEYDISEERFFVLDYTGEKICALPESAEDYAREKHEIPVEVGEDGKSIVFFK